MTVHIYSEGLCFCSVCAPAEMPIDEVEKAVNTQRPIVGLCWTKAEDEFFRTGEPNGGEVECSNGHTRHWLLSC